MCQKDESWASRCVCPSKGAVQAPRGEQVLQLRQANVGPPLEIAACQSCSLKGEIEFLGPKPGIPLGSEIWQGFGQPAEINSVTARVGTSRASVLNLASWRDLLHGLGQLSYLVIFVINTDVKHLIVDCVSRRCKGRGKSGRNVFHMDNGSPGCPVAQDADSAGRVGPAHQVVEY